MRSAIDFWSGLFQRRPTKIALCRVLPRFYIAIAVILVVLKWYQIAEMKEHHVEIHGKHDVVTDNNSDTPPSQRAIIQAEKLRIDFTRISPFPDALSIALLQRLANKSFWHVIGLGLASSFLDRLPAFHGPSNRGKPVRRFSCPTCQGCFREVADGDGRLAL
jgi:hypothetical protein